MNETNLQDMFLDVNDVCTILKRKPTYCYKVIRELNEELREQGKYIVDGRIPKRYFEERIGLNVDWKPKNEKRK